MRSGDDQRADLEGASLHEHRRHGSAAAIEPRLDDGAFRAAVGVGDEIEQLGLQRNRLEKLVEIRPLGRRHFDREGIAAKRLDLHVVLQELLHHPLGIGLGLVDLVDGDDDRSLGRLGVANRLDRLRHDAVVRRHDQHDDVGDLRAARAHRGEGRVTGRVDEGDGLAAGRNDLVGADVLRDAARFARDHIGVADRVEQRGLAVIDVAHDGDDRRPRNGRAFLVGPIEEALLDVGFGDALDRMAHFLGDELGVVGLEHVGQRHHAALAHQKLDHVDRAFGHAARELLDRDRFRQDDLARDFLFLLLRAVASQPLRAATERGDRTRAFFFARSRAGDGQPAAIALLAGARRPRRRDDDLLSRRQRQRWAPDNDPRRRLFGCAGRGGAAGARASVPGGEGAGAAGATRGIDGDCAGSPPARRRRASSSDWRLKLASWARRSSSSRLRASAASRSTRSRASRSRRTPASASWRRRSSSSWARASISARARASRCSADKVGRTTPVLGGGGAVGFAGATGAGRARRRARAWRGPAQPAADAAARRRPRGCSRFGRRQNPPLHLLDDDRLAAPVREALPHRALLNRALQVQSRLRRRGSRCLVAITRITHAYS